MPNRLCFVPSNSLYLSQTLSKKPNKQKSPLFRAFKEGVTPRGVETSTLLGYTLKLQEIFIPILDKDRTSCIQELRF